MGKYSLLITLGVISAITILSLHGQDTASDTREQQSIRQGQVIARQIARSGYNSVLAEARMESRTGGEKTVQEIVDVVGRQEGKYEGGRFEAWLEKISPTAYRAKAIGYFEVAGRTIEYRVGDGYGGNRMVQAPEIDQPSTLSVTFEQSQAGYCSAIYLKRVLPDTEPQNQPRPEMVFPPGHNRNDATASYDSTISPGTKLNFILAVDKNCSEEGNTSADYPEDYDHTNKSFTQDVSQLNTMREAPYGMVEETTVGGADGWRVSFEDQRIFSEEQLWDIKDHGYPDNQSWDSQNKTYGGDGWESNNENLNKLRDFGDIPDFSDQVFRVAVTDPDEQQTAQAD